MNFGLIDSGRYFDIRSLLNLCNVGKELHSHFSKLPEWKDRFSEYYGDILGNGFLIWKRKTNRSWYKCFIILYTYKIHHLKYTIGYVYKNCRYKPSEKHKSEGFIIKYTIKERTYSALLPYISHINVYPDTKENRDTDDVINGYLHIPYKLQGIIDRSSLIDIYENTTIVLQGSLDTNNDVYRKVRDILHNTCTIDSIIRFDGDISISIYDVLDKLRDDDRYSSIEFILEVYRVYMIEKDRLVDEWRNTPSGKITLNKKKYKIHGILCNVHSRLKSCEDYDVLCICSNKFPYDIVKIYRDRIRVNSSIYSPKEGYILVTLTFETPSYITHLNPRYSHTITEDEIYYLIKKEMELNVCYIP